MRRLTPKFGRARLNRFAIEPRSRPEPATAFGERREALRDRDGRRKQGRPVPPRRGCCAPRGLATRGNDRRQRRLRTTQGIDRHRTSGGRNGLTTTAMSAQVARPSGTPSGTGSTCGRSSDPSGAHPASALACCGDESASCGESSRWFNALARQREPRTTPMVTRSRASGSLEPSWWALARQREPRILMVRRSRVSASLEPRSPSRRPISRHTQ